LGGLGWRGHRSIARSYNILQLTDYLFNCKFPLNLMTFVVEFGQVVSRPAAVWYVTSYCSCILRFCVSILSALFSNSIVHTIPSKLKISRATILVTLLFAWLYSLVGALGTTIHLPTHPPTYGHDHSGYASLHRPPPPYAAPRLYTQEQRGTRETRVARPVATAVLCMWTASGIHDRTRAGRERGSGPGTRPPPAKDKDTRHHGGGR